MIKLAMGDCSNLCANEHATINSDSISKMLFGFI